MHTLLQYPLPFALQHGSATWNLWHGCHKLSAGCRHCYVYRSDAQHDIDSSVVRKTKSFELPIQKKRNGEYKIAAGTVVYTCFTSDFFVEDADLWRAEAWEMIGLRKDLRFLIITKRIERLKETLPNDWGEGYEHVSICCTIENQERADYRLPIYRAAPIKHKTLICEPLLERIDLRPYGIGSWVEQVVVGGESGEGARPCHFDWVLEIREVCIENNVSFWFKQTGARFVKDGRLYYINRRLQHAQARKAGINISSRQPS
ncbi:MAG: phage Gp37/Gp68 family protein [Cystobacterineae bacterium]|nr:phage Gp37/Gp68 family protein [Cystobacterineae bacterium]MCL2259047.1 phage Gp37/Gp68 family protein [Cystobacterineae bacterium]